MTPPPAWAGEPPASADAGAWAVMRAVAAYGLPAAPPIPTVGDDALAWRRIIGLAEQQRVLGLLVAAVRDGRVAGPEGPLDGEARSRLAAAHEAWCAHDLRLERALLAGADALDRAGISYLVTKGPAMAHRAYPDAGQRLFADLDLIVPSGYVAAATRVLVEALDATPALVELRPGFDERFGKETLLRTTATPGAPAGLEIDVHRTPVAGALGLAIPLDELFERPGRVEVAGRVLPTPGPVATLLLAAYQASVADVPPRLGARRDLVQLVVAGSAAGEAGVTLDQLVTAAGRWRASAVLATAVLDAWAGLALPVPDPDLDLGGQLVAWASRRRPTLIERLMLDAHRRPGYVYWRQLAGVVVVSGWSDRLHYLGALVWPQADYLADRRWSVARHLRRAWRTLTGPVRHRVVGAARQVRGRWLRRTRGRRLRGRR